MLLFWLRVETESSLGVVEDSEQETSPAEQKAFVRSFIKKIWIDYPTIAIEYTFPIDNEGSNSEVLIINRSG